MTGAEAEIVLDMHAAGRDVLREAVAEALQALDDEVGDAP